LRGLLLLLLLILAPGQAAEPPAVTIHYFRAEGCPHCEDAGQFLARYRNDARVLLRDYEVGRDPDGRERFTRVAEALRLQDAGVPFIVIGDWAVIGWHSDAWTGAAVEAQVARCRDKGCPDLVSDILAGRAPPPLRLADAGPLLPEKLKLPLLGEVDTASLSLPLLTIALGALDGFNPCAMWALVFLLGLLMGTRDRRRMWLLGLAFLFGSALVYFLIMAAWLNVLLALGFLVWVRIAVGLVALAAAAWHLHDYVTNPDAACEVSHAGPRQATLARLKRIALQERLWPALAGVLALAIAVNLIELVCSAGIPAVYTQVLALTPLPAWQHYGYLLLYILVFMLDDVALFAIAATTLQLTGFGARYARASRLIGAVALSAIGLLLLFRPQWLSFG